MPSSHHDIVVTGFGVVSPIGTGTDAFWQSLVQHRGAVELIQPYEGASGRRWLAGLVHDLDAKAYIQPRKSLKVMCIETQMSFVASVLACRRAGIEPGTIEPDRLGTVFGSEMLYSENEDIRNVVKLCQKNGQMQHNAWGAIAMEHMYPLWMLKSLPNMAACHIGIWIDARGPNNTLTCDETSGGASIIEAAQVIRRGQADCMIVGACGSKTSLTRMLQRDESNYSTNYDNPVAACKPFDQDRDGSVSGNGSASIILERRSHAEARGATILARLVSWSSTFGCPEHPWGGSSDAVARSISQSLERGQIEVAQIDHVNACAKGVIAFDSSEAKGIALALGDTPVTSIKGYIGDPGASSGLIELCASLAGIPDRLVPATLNHRQTAVDCPINVIHGENKPWSKPGFIKTSLTPHGQATSILMSIE